LADQRQHLLASAAVVVDDRVVDDGERHPLTLTGHRVAGVDGVVHGEGAHRSAQRDKTGLKAGADGPAINKGDLARGPHAHQIGDQVA